MWVPQAIQSAEARRGQRFVDRRVVLEPWIPARNRAGVGGETAGKIRSQQAGMAWTTSVVDQPGDHGDPRASQGRQLLIGPAPIRLPPCVGRDAFPQHGVADGADPERGKAVNIVRSSLVAIERDLAEILVADPVDCALHAAP